MARFAGCVRFVYNKALASQKERHANGEKKLGYAALCRELTGWRHTSEMSFLSEAPTHPLQQGLKDLERAYTNFFEGRSSFPRFKKKGRKDSFRYPDPKQFKVDETNSRVFLPKLGWVRFRKSRAIQGTVKQITISRQHGKWYICFQTERELVPGERVSDSMVGIDVGIARFATLSDGTVYLPRSYFETNGRRLAKQQRKLADKRKFSANWYKQLRRVQRTHRRIADSRRDFLHKISTAICKSHAVVVIEDLNVKGMSASAAGTLEKPGKNVKAKSGLNRRILDQSWGEFRRQLEYKQLWAGGTVVLVAARNTSRTCFRCGHVNGENRKCQAEFKCVSCGHVDHADRNAARNILAAGRAALARGEMPLGISMKQEPTVSAASAA